MCAVVGREKPKVDGVTRGSYGCPANVPPRGARYRTPDRTGARRERLVSGAGRCRRRCRGLGTLALSWRDPEAAGRALETTTGRTTGSIAANVVFDERGAATESDRLPDVVLDSDADAVSLSFGNPDGYVRRRLDAGKTTLVTVVTDLVAEATATLDGAAGQRV